MPRIAGFYRKLPEDSKPKQQKGFPEIVAWWKQEDAKETEMGHFDGGILYAILEATIKPGQYKMQWMVTCDEDDVAPGRGSLISTAMPHNPQGIPKNKQEPCCQKYLGGKKKCKLPICREENVMNKWSCGNPKCQLPLCRDVTSREKPKLIEPTLWLSQNRFEWEKWLREWTAFMPDKLYLIAPPKQGLQGEYIKNPSRLHNGCTIWQLNGGQRGYLYSARGGVWVVAASEEQMLDGAGSIQSELPHMGKEPQDCAGWKFNPGHGHGWFLHPQIRFITSGEEFSRCHDMASKKWSM